MSGLLRPTPALAVAAVGVALVLLLLGPAGRLMASPGGGGTSAAAVLGAAEVALLRAEVQQLHDEVARLKQGRPSAAAGAGGGGAAAVAANRNDGGGDSGGGGGGGAGYKDKLGLTVFPGGRSTEERLADLEEHAARAEWKGYLALEWSYPWENCMRVEHRGDCTEEEVDAEWAAGMGTSPKAPCRVNLLRDMISYVEKRMTSRKVEHWWSFGTVLGAARNKRIIPWTLDVDVALAKPEFRDIHKHFSKDEILNSGWYFLRDPQYPALARLCIAPHNKKYKRYQKLAPERPYFYDAQPYVDIYALRDGDGANSARPDLIVANGPPCRFRRKDIYPLGEIEVFGMKLPAPGNVSNFLTALYGPDWKKPPSKDVIHGHGGYTVSCRPQWQPTF